MTTRSRVPLAVAVGVFVGCFAASGCGDLRTSLSSAGGAKGGAAASGGPGGRGTSGTGGGPSGIAGHGGQGAAAGGSGATNGLGGADGWGGAGTGGAPSLDAATDQPDAPMDSPVGSGGVVGTAGAGGGGPVDAGTDLASGAGGKGAGGAPAPGATNGTTCAQDRDCQSGHCVDRVCCNDACTGQCEACDVATLVGTCAFVTPGGPPHGARSACAGSGTCGGRCDGRLRNVCAYPSAETSCRTQSCSVNTKVNSAVCDGKGACAAAVTVTCPMGCSGTECLGACAADAQCAAATPATPYCDQGVCTALKPNGRPCAAAADCTSNQCADGVCCDTACTDQCTSCNEPSLPGKCQLVRGAPRTGRAACAGSDACQGSCDGQSKTCHLPGSSVACGAPVCSNGTLTPVGTCNGAGTCAQTAAACATGYCAASGTSCAPCPNDTACGTGKWCDPAPSQGATCLTKKADGTSCKVGQDSQCANGHCVADLNGNGVCCAISCSGATPRCNAAGTACVCTTSSCGANICSNGACCVPNDCTSECSSIDCDPKCGLPIVHATCNGACCGSQCCGPSERCCDTGTATRCTDFSQPCI